MQHGRIVKIVIYYYSSKTSNMIVYRHITCYSNYKLHVHGKAIVRISCVIKKVKCHYHVLWNTIITCFHLFSLTKFPCYILNVKRKPLKHSYPTLNVYGNCHFMQVVLVHAFVTSC
jgi:hypothetical protein